MNSFVNIKDNNLFFSGCSTCEGNCCNGAKGFSLSPLILEDFEEVYKNFAIVFSVANNELKAFVVLNNGKGHCKYYINNQCSIYEQRTPACKLYPISPYFDEILIDTECPSINHEYGESISHNGNLNTKFYTERLTNFHEKLKKTTQFYATLDDINAFKLLGYISEMPLFTYTKQIENKYIEMHQQSLVHLDLNTPYHIH